MLKIEKVEQLLFTSTVVCFGIGARLNFISQLSNTTTPR